MLILTNLRHDGVLIEWVDRPGRGQCGLLVVELLQPWGFYLLKCWKLLIFFLGLLFAYVLQPLVLCGVLWRPCPASFWRPWRKRIKEWLSKLRSWKVSTILPWDPASVAAWGSGRRGCGVKISSWFWWKYNTSHSHPSKLYRNAISNISVALLVDGIWWDGWDWIPVSNSRKEDGAYLSVCSWLMFIVQL